MFKSLRDFLEQLPHLAEPDPQAVDHALQLAAAVMLVEVMRADATIRPVERDAVHRALREQFALSQEEAVELAEHAARTAARSTDLFEFTSVVDAHLDMAQRIRIVEHMCRVAYADGTLSDHERHILWRIADLLHVPQGAYVHARTRARQAAEQAQPQAAPASR